MILNDKRQIKYLDVIIPSLIGLSILGTTGCAKVEAWDKGNFTKPSMEVQPWSMPAYMNNKTIGKALESSRGGTSLGGGGCGCG